MFGEDEKMLWAGTLSAAGLEERADAAVAGGFDRTSLFTTDYRRARDEGLTDADIVALHGSRGLRLETLDPYTRWLPEWRPPSDASPRRLEVIGASEEEFFGICGALGVTTMTAIEPFGAEYSDEQLIEAFAALCDRAAQTGLRVQLEFTPWSSVPDLARAWKVVAGADRPNGGILVDVWHYFRGTPDDELLESIPGERIFSVQVSDAVAPIGELVEDSWLRRRLPGEGEFDLDTVLGILDCKEGIGHAGVEALSEELDRQTPVEVGRRAGASLDAALAAARAARDA
jgi:sugar phosphate isomerase/epimerase